MLVPSVLRRRGNLEVRLSNLWLGDEGSSRDGEAAADRAERLSHDGETAPLSAACAGCQSLHGGTEGGDEKRLSLLLMLLLEFKGTFWKTNGM